MLVVGEQGGLCESLGMEVWDWSDLRSLKIWGLGFGDRGHRMASSRDVGGLLTHKIKASKKHPMVRFIEATSV